MEQIAVTHFRRALRTFVSRHGALLEERGAGLVNLFQRWLDTAGEFDTVWHIAFGRMREVLAEQHRPSTQAEVLLAAARLGLRLGECGMAGSWRLSLDAPVALRWGTFLLPASDRFEVLAEDDILVLTLATSGLQLRRRGVGWERVAGEANAIPSFDTGERTVGLFFPDSPEGRENMEAELVVDDAVRAQITGAYRSGFALLGEYAPDYVPFVNRLLRNLIPIAAAPGAYVGGGSMRDNPGSVKLPFEGPLVGMAASLGHECAHQHYFLSRGAGRIDDGSDTSLYRSGFVSGERDLPSMVLTYHAFANEAIVLRLCELGGCPDPYAAQRAELIRGTLAPLEDILGASRALTPLGRALWQPVAEQVHRLFS